MKKKQTVDKEIFTLRISCDKNAQLRALAEEISISQNALMLILIDLGLKGYEKTVSYLRE